MSRVLSAVRPGRSPAAVCVAVLVLALGGCAPLQPMGQGQPTTTYTITPETIAPVTPATPASTVAPVDGPVAPGTSGRIRVAVDGRERDFLLHVPEGYSPEQNWPLILAFHGWRERAETLEDTTRLDSAAALVAYMEGVDQAWAPAPYASTSMAEDLAYSQAVVTAVDDAYDVDADHISVIGFSNGGGFAAALACQIPEQISGVATVAAAYYEKVHENCKDTPVAHIDLHGTADDVIGYYGGERHETAYTSVDEVLENAAERNNCSGPVTATRETAGTLDFRWSDCDRPLEHIRIGGGGHVWPGGTKDANDELGDGYGTYRILRFFGIDWTEWKGN